MKVLKHSAKVTPERMAFEKSAMTSEYRFEAMGKASERRRLVVDANEVLVFLLMKI